MVCFFGFVDINTCLYTFYVYHQILGGKWQVILFALFFELLLMASSVDLHFGFIYASSN